MIIIIMKKKLMHGLKKIIVIIPNYVYLKKFFIINHYQIFIVEVGKNILNLKKHMKLILLNVLQNLLMVLMLKLQIILMIH
jgi:hypothetical protein